MDAESFPVVIVFVMGGPGSGKTTQSTKLAKDYGMGYISLGELFYAEINNGISCKGRYLKKLHEQGHPIPFAEVLFLVRQFIMKNNAFVHGYVVDDFPPCVQQGQDFERVVGPSAFILLLECDEETMRRRLSKRYLLSRRESDEDEHLVNEKLQTFHEQRGEVMDYYKLKEQTIKVNANLPPDQVYAQIVKVMNDVVV